MNTKMAYFGHQRALRRYLGSTRQKFKKYEIKIQEKLRKRTIIVENVLLLNK